MTGAGRNLGTADALAAYEAARHRMPRPAVRGRASRRASGLHDIAADYDIFLLDAFGVLNIGETAIPGVPERVADLQSAGKRVLIVSNAAGFPHDRLMEKYARLGYDFAPEDVVTSRKALARGIAAETGQGATWGLMISDGVDAAEFGTLDHVRLGDDPSAYDAADAFVMIGSATWTEARQARLEAALTERPRRLLVGNPDIVAPRDVGFSTEPGYFAHRLADRTGVVPEFFGKPFGNIYDLAFARLGSDARRDRMVMVGDSLHTDILGAQVAGIAGALVTDYGFLAGTDADAAIAATGIVPDIMVPRP